MKGLLKIVAGGFVAFMALAIVQEWDTFSSAWFGREPDAVELGDDEREAAADTLRLVLSLMAHLYASGGDPRFTERMPASDGVKEEMLADVAYLARNHRRQEMSLERLDLTGLEPFGAERVEIRTRELWHVRFVAAGGGAETDPPRRQAAHGKYLLVRGASGWVVEGWELLDPARDREGAEP